MTPLQQAQYWIDTVGNHSLYRPTEKAALDLWRFGYINLRAYFGKLVIPNWAERTRLTIHEEDLKAEHPARGSFGQMCNDCGRRRPLTSHYWHRDKRQRNGYKTICKICDKRKRQKSVVTLRFCRLCSAIAG
jgi:hypothetical protein